MARMKGITTAKQIAEAGRKFRAKSYRAQGFRLKARKSEVNPPPKKFKPRWVTSLPKKGS